LARALKHVVNLLDPDVIVLGSGLSNPDRLCETCYDCDRASCFPMAWTRASPGMCTTIPAAPRGYGRAGNLSRRATQGRSRYNLLQRQSPVHSE